MTRRRRPRTSEERLISAVGSVACGVVGGRVRNVRQAPPLQRNTGPAAASGSFDPNASPLIMGAGASATDNGSTDAIIIGGGATATGIASGDTRGVILIGSNTSSADINTVVIGEYATATGNAVVVIGKSATSNGGTSVGWESTSAQGSVAIGGGSTAAGVSGSGSQVAVGDSSTASGDSATALGESSDAGHTHATAVGAGAATSAANQVMLGTAADFVEIPGDSSSSPNGLVLTDTATGTRYIVQITSGALVLNTAP